MCSLASSGITTPKFRYFQTKVGMQVFRINENTVVMMPSLLFNDAASLILNGGLALPV